MVVVDVITHVIQQAQVVSFFRPITTKLAELSIGPDMAKTGVSHKGIIHTLDEGSHSHFYSAQ